MSQPDGDDGNSINNFDPSSSTTTVCIDPDSLSAGGRYGLCISAVVPRPVAVITTVDENGIVNCAPFSYSGISSHDPPIVTHGLCLSNGNKKDTLRNIESTGRWVFNVLSTNYLEQANQCSASLPSDVNEAEINGLDLVWDCKSFGIASKSDDNDAGRDASSSQTAVPPRLAAARVSMECHLIDKKEIYNDEGKHSTTIVIGRVRRFHISKDVYKESDRGTGVGASTGSTLPERPLVDLEALQPVGRAGDITYFPVGTGTREVEVGDGDGEGGGGKRRRKEVVLAMTRPQANYVGNPTQTTTTK
jgi:flavin reductase (DIM6/NTAB) family NADH-FMN oxidoreductase RutF